jgi:hypothetical protein
VKVDRCQKWDVADIVLDMFILWQPGSGWSAGPAGGAYSAPPDSLAGSKGKGVKRRGEELTERKGGEERRVMKGKERYQRVWPRHFWRRDGATVVSSCCNSFRLAQVTAVKDCSSRTFLNTYSHVCHDGF